MHNVKFAICVNFCSNLENNNEIYSLAQYEASKLKVEASDSESDQSNIGDCCSNNNIKENIDDNNSKINNNNTNVINADNSTDDYKHKLLECTKESKLKQEQENPEILINKSCKIELHSIKAANSPPSSQTNPTTTDNELNEDRHISATNNNNNNTNNLCSSIKHEKPCAINVNPSNTINTTSSNNNKNLTDTPPLDNTTKLIDTANNKQSIVRENSLSPLRQNNLQSNFINASDNKTNSNNNNNNSNKNLLLAKTLEEKRPKSVTASVFRPATLTDLSGNHSTTTTTAATITPPTPVPSTTSTSSVFVSAANAPPLLPLNAAPRAQSVTASVFTPISQLCNRQQQHIAKTNSIITPTTVTAAILSGQQQHQHQNHQNSQQTQDMNKFLSFGDETNELTMLKEEPDDLSHLAPAALDACLRLDDTAPFCGEMLLGLCSYAYGGFLPDDYSSLDSTASSSSPDTSNHNSNNNNAINTSNSNVSSSNSINSGNNNKISLSSPTHQQHCNSNLNAGTLHNGSNNNNSNNLCNKPVVRIDPFINYRDESNDTNCSQHLLSPSAASKSPEASSLPSLCSPNSLSQDDGFAFMTMSVDEDIDMSMRAPYIPMNEQEDLPLLTADDLMWCASNGLGSEELNNQKDVDATLQQLQLQQQHTSESNHNLLSGYHDAQHINQSHFNSLCSSPASTVSSLSPSPVNHQQQQQSLQQQQLQDASCVYSTDTSELAALLCGSGNGTLSILNNNCGGVVGSNGTGESDIGLQQQQQQQQRHCGDFRLQQLEQEQQRHLQLLGLNIDCKKESSLSPSLCDSLEDTFDNVYSKDSANLDCWNELLQINVSDTSSSASPSPVASLNSPTQQHQQQHKLDDCKTHLRLDQQLSSPQQQQQQQQHNIILNAVPLITIQDTKNILLQQQQQQQQQLNVSNKMLIKDEMLPANRGGHKITTIKLLNGQATTITTPNTIGTATTGATVRMIDVKQQQQHQSHKRHLVPSTQLENKRMRSAAMDMQAVPQLLQQLVSPMQPQQHLKEQQQKQQQQQQQARKTNNVGVSRWIAAGDVKANANGMQQQPQQSNSVLKNLLISGCDTTSFNKQSAMLMDEDSLDQAPSPPMSAMVPSLIKPLHCQTSTAALLRNYRHNPMIGGPGVLPSPPFGPASCNASPVSSNCCEVSPPGLTPADTESTSDSGIDDISMIETSSPIKVQLEQPSSPHFKSSPTSGCSAATKDMLLMKCLNSKAAKKRAMLSEAQLKQQQQPLTTTGVNTSNGNVSLGESKTANNQVGGRKGSLTSFIDNINPLMEPFIMDLCNDDYDVATEPLLGSTGIDHVLNNWSHDMA